MADKKREIDPLLIQKILSSKLASEEDQAIVINSDVILELLEEQASSGLRGMINDRPRWSE